MQFKKGEREDTLRTLQSLTKLIGKKMGCIGPNLFPNKMWLSQFEPASLMGKWQFLNEVDCTTNNFKIHSPFIFLQSPFLEFLVRKQEKMLGK